MCVWLVSAGKAPGNFGWEQLADASIDVGDQLLDGVLLPDHRVQLLAVALPVRPKRSDALLEGRGLSSGLDGRLWRLWRLWRLREQPHEHDACDVHCGTTYYGAVPVPKVAAEARTRLRG